MHNDIDCHDSGNDDITLDQVEDELGQGGDQAGHAALGDGAQRQDHRLLELPLRVDKSFLER